MRPLCSWLEVAKALQEEIPARLQQTSNCADIVLSPFRWQDVEATPVEDEVELPGKPGGEDVILLPGDREPLRLCLFACEPDGGFRDIGRGDSKASMGELHRLRARAGGEVERAAASQPTLIQRLPEVVVQLRVEPGHGLDCLLLIHRVPAGELPLL